MIVYYSVTFCIIIMKKCMLIQYSVARAWEGIFKKSVKSILPPPRKINGASLTLDARIHTHTYTPLRFDLPCEWSQYIPYVLCWNIIHLFHVDLFTKCSGAYLLPINLHHAVTIVHICSLYLPILHEMQAFGTSIIGFVKAFVVSGAVQFAWYTVRRHLDLHKSPVHYRIVLLKVTRWHCWR